MIGTTNDEHYMRMALREAERAFAADEIPIGTVIVCNDTVIARGHNLTERLNDVTAHAEMQAITAAAENLGGKYLHDCTIYVTVEPCLMCVGALVHARIRTLVFGAREPKAGAVVSMLRAHEAIGLNHRLEVSGGVLEEDCRGIIQEFFKDRRAKA